MQLNDIFGWILSLILLVPALLLIPCVPLVGHFYKSANEFVTVVMINYFESNLPLNLRTSHL